MLPGMEHFDFERLDRLVYFLWSAEGIIEMHTFLMGPDGEKPFLLSTGGHNQWA